MEIRPPFSPRFVPILAYHYLDAAPGKRSLSVSLPTFEKQLQFLVRRQFQVVHFADLVKSLRGEKKLPSKAVVITFDDGEKTFYSKAYPLLMKYRLPATVFVASDWVGREGFVSWEELRSMSSEFVTVGSHTVTHRYLPDLSRDEIRDELFRSKEILEKELGRSVDFLSYPVGGFNPEIRNAAREAGYRAACSTNRGRNWGGKDLFALKRIKMTEGTLSPWVLSAKLSGYYLLPGDLFPKPPC